MSLCHSFGKTYESWTLEQNISLTLKLYRQLFFFSLGLILCLCLVGICACIGSHNLTSGKPMSLLPLRYAVFLKVFNHFLQILISHFLFACLVNTCRNLSFLLERRSNSECLFGQECGEAQRDQEVFLLHAEVNVLKLRELCGWNKTKFWQSQMLVQFSSYNIILPLLLPQSDLKTARQSII